MVVAIEVVGPVMLDLSVVVASGLVVLDSSGRGVGEVTVE